MRAHTHPQENGEECTARSVFDRTNPACHTSDQECRPQEDFRMLDLLSERLVATYKVHLTDDEILLWADLELDAEHCSSSS